VRWPVVIRSAPIGLREGMEGEGLFYLKKN
jgi:hypothetical protein